MYLVNYELLQAYELVYLLVYPLAFAEHGLFMSVLYEVERVYYGKRIVKLVGSEGRSPRIDAEIQCRRLRYLEDLQISYGSVNQARFDSVALSCLDVYIEKIVFYAAVLKTVEHLGGVAVVSESQN